MIQEIKNAAKRNGYLIIAAAWLYTVSFIFTNYFSAASSEAGVSATLHNYISEREDIFKALINDKRTVDAIISDDASGIKEQLIEKDMGIFTYQVNDRGNPVQIYWNTNKIIVNENYLRLKDGIHIINNPRNTYELIKKTIQKNGIDYYVAGIIPIKENYFINNEYLVPHFPASADISSNFQIVAKGKGTSVLNSEGRALFKILDTGNARIDNPGIVSITLRLAAILLLLVMLNSIAIQVTISGGFFKGFSFLISVLAGLRFIVYKFPIPFNLKQFELFSPSYYASSSLNSSLGDLLINIILLYWLLIFTRLNFKPKKEWLAGTLAEKIIAYGSLALLPLITLQFARLISSLVTDSQVTLDASNFFSLNVYAFVIFIIIAFITLCFYHASSILLCLACKIDYPLIWRICFLGGAGLFFILIDSGHLPRHVSIVVTLWLILYVAFMYKTKTYDSLSLVQSPKFILWSVLLIASVTALVSHQNETLEKIQRLKIADKLERQTDPSGERWLNMSIAYFTTEFLQNNFNRFYSNDQNKFITDSLITQNFSGHLNKYDTRIYVFDSLHRPLHNEDATSYEDIKSIIINGSKPTNIEGLYYYENESDRFSYLYEAAVFSKTKDYLGTVILLLNPKVYKDVSLVPELFKQVDDISHDLITRYAYAIYTNRKLVRNFNDYDFSDSLPMSKIPALGYSFVNTNGYSQLFYKAGKDRIIEVVYKNNRLVYYIALFSYLFFTFIIIAALLYFGFLLFRTGFNTARLNKVFRINIRRQIQVTIIAVSVFSFFIIGAVTISFFIQRFNNTNKERLNNIAQILVNEIQNQLRNQINVSDNFTIDDIGIKGDLERRVIEIAGIHNTDLNLFNKSGNLIVSTQPYIFNKEILNSKMHPTAYNAMHYKRMISIIQEENIARLSILSLYMPIKDEEERTIGYINIPYLNAQKELKQEISEFLVTLINLNAIIFILAGALAILLTSNITRSFEFIGAKMKEINLGKTNALIEWARKDEMGALVNEYNKMLKKLERSAEALARSEREGAWREMARQVAHEIKNPLTPMKLSIQYLQKAINANAPNTKELSQQVAKTLVEQIDQLAKIAGDFSQFANIGNVQPEKFNVQEVISSVINLYSTNSRIKIEWIKTEEPLNIFADKNQVHRLFTNLIKNAVEATPDLKDVCIYISIEKKDRNILISLRDEGSGIPDEMRTKIFEPNFTTKSSGTGLGLAISKAITEKANGKIWFTSAGNTGTTFFVQFPHADAYTKNI